MNSVVLIGRIGVDADLRWIPNGTAVLNLKVVTTTTWTSDDGHVEDRSEWTAVTVWGRWAEVLAPRLEKGTAVFVEGKLRTAAYEKNGQRMKRYWVHALRLHRLNDLPKPPEEE